MNRSLRRMMAKRKDVEIKSPDKFNDVYTKMNEDEQNELLCLCCVGYVEGNVRYVGFETLRRENEYRLKMIEKYAPGTPYAVKSREDYERLIS